MKWLIGALACVAGLLLNSTTSAAAVETGPSTYRAASPLAPGVRDLSPLPGTSVRAFFPRISASIVTHGAPLRRGSLRAYIDGEDVTASAAFAGDTVSYTPRAHLHAGWHDVFLQGSDRANHAFSQAWVFQTQNPDIDTPIGTQGGFIFLPVGVDQGAFTHFFLVSPFDGFGFVQFCGFHVPLAHAIGTPIFFVTVPVTFASAFFGCNAGVFFTPFQAGIGALNPVFFPIAVAGPGFFQNGGEDHRGPRPMMPAQPMMPSGASGTATMPIYRAPGMPVYRTQPMPVYRTRAPMPVYRTQPMPIRGAPSAVIPQPSIPY